MTQQTGTVRLGHVYGYINNCRVRVMYLDYTDSIKINSPAHSLHAYFLFGGDISAPIIYEVDRLRDGKSFVSRQVRAIQHGRTIFTAMVSFAAAEEGLNYQRHAPDVPAPENLKNEKQIKEGLLEFVPENVRT